MMKTPDPQRRVFLRGAIATGISLTLFACNRTPETGTTRQAPAEETPAPQPKADAPSAAAPGAKVTKAMAHYQEQPNGDLKCASCVNFISESNTCKVVEGPISPEGWCVYWALKT